MKRADLSDIGALQADADAAEKRWKEANAEKELAVAEAKKAWRLAAAAHSRYSRAKEKMERTQMRGGVAFP